MCIYYLGIILTNTAISTLHVVEINF